MPLRHVSILFAGLLPVIAPALAGQRAPVCAEPVVFVEAVSAPEPLPELWRADALRFTEEFWNALALRALAAAEPGIAFRLAEGVSPAAGAYRLRGRVESVAAPSETPARRITGWDGARWANDEPALVTLRGRLLLSFELLDPRGGVVDRASLIVDRVDEPADGVLLRAPRTAWVPVEGKAWPAADVIDHGPWSADAAEPRAPSFERGALAATIASLEKPEAAHAALAPEGLTVREMTSALGQKVPAGSRIAVRALAGRIRGGEPLGEYRLFTVGADGTLGPLEYEAPESGAADTLELRGVCPFATGALQLREEPVGIPFELARPGVPAWRLTVEQTRRRVQDETEPAGDCQRVHALRYDEQRRATLVLPLQGEPDRASGAAGGSHERYELGEPALSRLELSSEREELEATRCPWPRSERRCTRRVRGTGAPQRDAGARMTLIRDEGGALVAVAPPPLTLALAWDGESFCTGHRFEEREAGLAFVPIALGGGAASEESWSLAPARLDKELSAEACHAARTEGEGRYRGDCFHTRREKGWEIETRYSWALTLATD